MTGYGSVTVPLADQQATLSVELRSVNLRFLDVKVRQPFGMLTERKLRKQVSSRVGRGRVEVHVNIVREAVAAEAEQLREALDAVALASAVAGEKNVELTIFSALELLRFVGSRTGGGRSIEQAPEELWAAADRGLADLVEMRRAEGAALCQVLATLANELEAEVAGIAATLEGEEQRLLAKAREHITTILQDCDGTDPEADARLQERIVSEVGVLIHKGDVAEELARIDSHLEQWRGVLAATAKPGQGKTLDFLCQELFREVTTIGSKITAHAGSRRVIAAKGIVERMREQVQNVE